MFGRANTCDEHCTVFLLFIIMFSPIALGADDAIFLITLVNMYRVVFSTISEAFAFDTVYIHGNPVEFQRFISMRKQWKKDYKNRDFVHHAACMIVFLNRSIQCTFYLPWIYSPPFNLSFLIQLTTPIRCLDKLARVWLSVKEGQIDAFDADITKRATTCLKCMQKQSQFLSQV